MSLTASMWTSVSGLLNHGEKMNVVGNNIANVNTVAFKGSRMDFMDYVHQDVHTASGPAQVGRGVAIGAIYGDFSQGAFESSTESTDIAISGKGFFKVIPKYNNQSYYTRAGNFRFDADGYLVDPHGYVLQGWQVELPSNTFATSVSITSSQYKNKANIIGVGVPQDIRLSSFSCDPRHTQNITESINLDQNMGAEKAVSSHYNPFFAMFENWDTTPNAAGQIVNPLGPDGFAYQQSITVYDEGGAPHVLTIYFDKVDTKLDGTPPRELVANAEPGKNTWEFIVTMEPTEDVRLFGAQFDVAGNYIPGTGTNVPPDRLGLLMAGTLTFNSAGQIVDIMGYVPTEGGGTQAAYTGVAFTPTTPATWAAAGVDFGNTATYQGVAVANSVGGGPAVFDLLTPNTWPIGFNPWDRSTWNLIAPTADLGQPATWPSGLVFGTAATYTKQMPTTAATGFYDMNTWVAAPLSSEGYPMFTPNFTGVPGCSEIWRYNDGINTAALPTTAVDGI
ncbi:MAG: flagellar hook-basal body complex protein, partial [Deltaproteobacteria bacterium]|nr:flagellar hook-basal body complex protein [Deltaproteobacteria bacterium]